MIATLPAPPYISEMIHVGYTADGSMKYTINGFFAEVFDNLQVSKADLNEADNLPFGIINVYLTVLCHYRKY